MRRPNTTFDVYRNGAVPPADPDEAGLTGHLRDAWVRGNEANEGDRSFLWTATLEVPLGVDLPDAYPAGTGQTTVWVPDRDGQAYTVVFVERERSFRGRDFKRVYLTRGLTVAITVKESDGTPSYSAVTTLLVNQDDGFVLTQPASNQAALSMQSASATQRGLMDTASQSFAGAKSFGEGITVALGAQNQHIALSAGAQTNRGSLLVATTGSNAWLRLRVFTSDSLDAKLDMTLDPLEASGPHVTFEYSGADATSSETPALRLKRPDGTIYTGQTGTLGDGSTVTGGLITTVGGGTYATEAYADAAATSALADATAYTDAEIAALSSVYQPLDGDLTALAALSSTGFAERTGANTWTTRTLVVGDLPELHGFTNATPGDADRFPFYKDATGNRDCSASELASYVLSTLTAGDLPAASDTAQGALEIAVQSELETPSSATLAVTPARLQYHPGVAKGWVLFDGTTATPTVLASHNVSSITDTATGRWAVVWNTDFSSASYGVALATEWDSGTAFYAIGIDGDSAPAAGSLPVANAVVGGGLSDSRYVSVVAFGDQA